MMKSMHKSRTEPTLEICVKRTCYKARQFQFFYSKRNVIDSSNEALVPNNTILVWS